MIIPLLAFKFLLFIAPSSSKSIEQSRNKPHCSAGEKGCVVHRSQRDAALTPIDYDNQYVGGDDDHPFFCDIVDPLNGIEDKIKKSSNVEEFVSKVLPFDVHKQNKKNYKSSQGDNFIKFMQESNSLDSDGFVCAGYGFFPDYNNRKMFYHCAHSSHDEGFSIRHKKCPSGLTFNGFHRICEANQLKTNRNVVQAKTLFKKKQEFFHCSHTGLFPDKFNASMFWYCARNRKNGFTVTKMLCPNNEIFDPVKKLCIFNDVPKFVTNYSNKK